MISPSELDTIRKRGYTDDEIWSKLSQSNPQYDIVKKRGYSLDDVASKYKGGEQTNENAESKSDQGTRSQGDAQRTLNGEVNATNAPGSEGGGELRPLDEGQSQRIYEARVSTDSVKGGENNAKQENAQAEAGYGPEVRKEDGQGVRSQEDARNEAQVKDETSGVQPPPQGFIERAKEDPLSALKAVGESAARGIIGLKAGEALGKAAGKLAIRAIAKDAAGTVAAAVAAPAAIAETAATGGIGALAVPAIEMGAFATGAYVADKAVDFVEKLVGIDDSVEEAKAKNPELAQAASIATMVPMAATSIKNLAAMGVKEATEKVVGGAIGGAAFEPIRYGVESALKAATGSEEEVSPITFGSELESIAVGGILSAHGYKQIRDTIGPETAKAALKTKTDPTIEKENETKIEETGGVSSVEGKPPVGEAEVKAEGGVAQGKREGEEEVAKEPTRVVAATFTPDPSNPEVYYTGASHEEAMEKAGVPVETDPAKREDDRFGFLHSDGTVNPREVSEQVGKESGQFEKQSDRPVAHSNDFDLDVVEPPKVSEEEKGFVKDLASQAREKMGRPGAASKEEFDEMRAVVGAEKIFEGATDKNEWKQRMLDEGYNEENGFTDQDLNKIWRNSKDFTNDFHSSMKGESLSPKRSIKKNIENKSYIPNSILELKQELGKSVSKAKALSEYFRGMQKGAKIGAASAREEGKAITKQKLEEKKKQFEEERASFKKSQQTQNIAMRWHDADKNKIKDSVNDLLFKQIPQSGIKMRSNDVARFSKKLQGILTTPFDPRGGKKIGDKFVSRSEIMWDRTSRLLDDIHASANDALATDLRTNIKSAYSDAMSSKTVFPEYKKQIRGLVSDIALRGMTPKTEAKLRALNDRLVAEGKDNSRVMERLADLSKTNIKDLSVDELDALNQQIKELTDLGKQEWKSRQEERTAEVERKKKELEAEDIKPINPAEKIIRDTAVGGIQKAKDYLYNSLQGSLNWLSVHEKARMTMPQLFTALDGKENGWLAKNVRNPLLNNFRDFAKDSNAIKEQAIEVANKNNLTENNFVKVAIHAYKEQGKTDEDLLKFSYDKNFKKILDKYNASGLTKGEQNLYKFMREALDKEAQNVVNHFADNENIEIKLVDKYFPFLVDKRKAENIVDPRTGVVLDPSKPSDSLKYSIDKAFHSKTIKAGMKYARVPDSDIPLNMNAMDVFLSHMDNWHYVKNVQPTLNEVSRIVQDPLFQQKYGLVGKNLMKDYIDVLARRGRYSKTQIEKGIDAVRNISMVGTLGFRLNQLKHIANYPLGMAEAGGAGWWSRGLIASKSQEGHDFLKKNMPEIFERSGGDVSIEEAARSGNKAIKAAFIGDRLLDYHNAVGVSLGKYFKGLEERGYNWKDFDKIPVDQELLNESYNAAIKSLGSPSILDQPLITSKGTSVGSRTFGKALMAYQMPKMVKWGRLRNAFTQELKGKKYGSFAKTMGLLAASSALEAAVAYGSKHAYIAAANGILNALGYQTYEREVDEPAIKAIMDEALLDYISPIPGSDIAKKYAQVKKYPTAREKILSQTGIPPIDVTTGIMNSGLDFAFDPTNEKKALRVAEDAASFLGPFSSIIQLEKEGKKLLDEEGQARRDAAEAEKEDSE